MYVHDLRIRHLKLIQGLPVSFLDASGGPRMWTVLIGRNGTCKTSILQAIALAAVGKVRANRLAEKVLTSLPDLRSPGETMDITATFGFGPMGSRYGREYPGFSSVVSPPPGPVRSVIQIVPGEGDISGQAQYLSHPAMKDPLVEARSREMRHWFVAGYGVERLLALPDPERRVVSPSIDRLRPLFGRVDLIGLGFADQFDEEGARRFHRILKRVLLKTKRGGDR